MADMQEEEDWGRRRLLVSRLGCYHSGDKFRYGPSRRNGQRLRHVYKALVSRKVS